MTPIDFYVTEIRQERVDIRRLGDAEPSSVSGGTFVEFRSDSGDRFDIDWTGRTDPLPEVGSNWTLTIEETP